MKKIFIIISTFLLISCNPEGENFIPDGGDIRGTYKLGAGRKTIKYKNNTNPETILIWNDCYAKGSLTIDSNYNFTIEQYELDGNDDCIRKTEKGILTDLKHSYGAPYGNLIYDNGFQADINGADKLPKTITVRVRYTIYNPTPEIEEISYVHNYGRIN
ncbi:hypothetical protein [Tenacibaculum amylolyticum]|uniref:hypothetical protein n=1 Tax=Tenacibaculum amylolyticum TaxID=104269 RepID=UPI003894B8D9